MCSDPALPALKSALRKTILTQRATQTAEARAITDAQIVQRLVQLPDYQRARGLLGYMNFGTEFASDIWVRQALADGKKLALPKVNTDTKQLELYWVNDLDHQLAAGAWGIREPIITRCEQLDQLHEIDFALLPGVAFTRQGARLGYGGGFYDKLLARFTHLPPLIAAAYSLQLVADVPQEVTDVNVAWIVTELETVQCVAEKGQGGA
jgi:5-formyltetrahydrofolate cyclo-ligase